MINFKEKLIKLIINNYELDERLISDLIEIPPQEEMGDYALPCFKLARNFRKAPGKIALELKEAIGKNKYFSEITNNGPYLNFFVNKELFARTILETILSQKEKYGAQEIGSGKNIVIDFSSPNIAKPFHVGHLRSTVIGNSLYKIYEFLGYNCIGINHLGDWGTQFGKMIAAYKKWGNDQEIKDNPIQTLLKLYVKFHDEAEKKPGLEDEGRLWFKKLEDGDEEANKLWKWFVTLSLEEFNTIYDILNVSFDYNTGESFYNDKMADIVQSLKEKGLLQKSKGAYVVDLEDYDMPPCLIIKSDGATLYPTRDITAAIYRKETYNFSKALYVTDYSQKLHFSQWMKIIELMGYDWADQLEHVPFGRVSSEEGALKTRKGNVILLKDLLAKSVEKVKRIINQNNPELNDKDEIAEKVGIGAIIFNDLSNSKIKDVVFNWDRMLSFDGETGPYIQYTHARANSVLEKGQTEINTLTDYSDLSNPEAFNLIKLLSAFPETIIKAMERNEPSYIARHIINLAQGFNKFYHEYPILVEDETTKKARLLLVFATKTVIKNGLSLLGIEAPDKM
ncbi:arginine--tRNA ligase [Halocella sp. SP3-1]|uniref:arginine--tRNA ligase n=1 Tax=Halocella sp. SP3-1 TaxID=2382161 RepID=UPI000F751545|nr:arginine--tRNA ligase [Halocella sp. SP3-1]AZO95512.1 arginine--tRNA ligase [Halocella sp. SP3-1]